MASSDYPWGLLDNGYNTRFQKLALQDVAVRQLTIRSAWNYRLYLERPEWFGYTTPGMFAMVGTLGSSGIVDELVRTGKLDVRGVQDVWEAFVWQVIDQPAPGVDRALARLELQFERMASAWIVLSNNDTMLQVNPAF